MQFKQTTLSCMTAVVSQVISSEQTQELRLGEGMPDVGRIIGAWGQPIMRGKEWHGDYFAFSGGMMIWVLYAPEEETQPRILSSWIPFQMRWELPQDTPEGDIRITCLNRYVDARSVSPRKIMVRAGMAALGEGYVRETEEIYTPEQESGNVQLLVNKYPVRVIKEAGEKAFMLDEELALPDSVPGVADMVYCTVDIKPLDNRVLADKLAFRGTGKLHLVYMSDAGQVHTWDFEMPFSQFAELSNAYGSEARGDVALAVTGMEPELTEGGRIRLKCAVVAQYLISDREMVEVAEDGYDPARELILQQQELMIPVMLDQSRLSLFPEQNIPAEANLAVDARFLPDFPLQRRNGEDVELTFPGTFQLLYYGSDGKLYGSAARWEGESTMKASPDTNLTVLPQAPDVQAFPGNGNIHIKAELPVEFMASSAQRLPMLTQILPGQERIPDPERPSLIIQRCGTERLWDIAKKNGSNVDGIRRMNGLEGEGEPGQLLLIPIP